MDGVVKEVNKSTCTWERLNQIDKGPSVPKLTDQSIDSKEYIKKYLAYT